MGKLKIIGYIVGVSAGIALLVASPQGFGGSAHTPRASGNPEKGKALYKQICASCHGDSGKGDGVAGTALDPKPTDLTDSEGMSHYSDPFLKAIIKLGKNDAMKQADKNGFTALWMPAFPNLKDDEIKALIALVRDIQKVKPAGDALKALTQKHSAANELYRSNCERCHGENFDGNGPDTQVKDKSGKKVLLQPLPPNFRNDRVVGRFSDSALKKIIKHGRQDAQEKARISSMTAFGGTWTDPQVADVTAYLRRLASPPPAPAKAK